MSKNNKMKNKAFTLIELIVVMAIIAILVLLAAPRFLGYTKDANVTAMKQDTRVLSDAVEKHHIERNQWPIADKVEEHGLGGVDELYRLDEVKLNKFVKNISGEYDDYGIAIGGAYEGEVFHIEGIVDKHGDMYYGDKNPSEYDKNYVKYLANDDDFVGDKNGEFRYIGDASIVYVPNMIKGVLVTNYSSMFEGTHVEKVISTNSNIVNMHETFKGLKSRKLDLSHFDTSKVRNMRYMFLGAVVEDIDFGEFDVSSVTDMGGMFERASRLKVIDTTGWDTSNVRHMWFMFAHTTADLDVSQLNTDKAISMISMFHASRSSSLDLRTFNTKNVTAMDQMFYGYGGNLKGYEDFDTTNLKSAKGMFRSATIDEIDLSGFDISNVEGTDLFFDKATASVGYALDEENANILNRLAQDAGLLGKLEFKVKK